jgi:hypothetical protein
MEPPSTPHERTFADNRVEVAVENRSNGPVYADLKKSVDTGLAAPRFTPPFDTFQSLWLGQVQWRGLSKRPFIPRANLGLIQRP